MFSFGRKDNKIEDMGFKLFKYSTNNREKTN